MSVQTATQELNRFQYGYKYVWMLKNCDETNINNTLQKAIKCACRYEDCKYDR